MFLKARNPLFSPPSLVLPAFAICANGGAAGAHNAHTGNIGEHPRCYIYNWGTAPILYYWGTHTLDAIQLGNTLDAIQLGTPLMLYNWGTPPTPHPIYFIASGPREMGQTRAGGIDPSVRTSCDHLCISCKLVSPILPESITITLFCILFRSPANPHHILVHCGISEKSPLILFLCHY